MVPLKYKIRTTNSLRQKLDIAMASARKGAQVACEEGARSIRDEVSEFLEQVYSTETEIKTLVTGLITESVSFADSSKGMVGTAEGGRLNRSKFTPLHQIIRNCRVFSHSGVATGSWAPALSRGGNRPYAQAGRVSEINDAARFFYDRRKQKDLQANPFNGRYIQSVLEGGVWNVAPRSDNPTNVLQPQPGVLARKMVKQVNPTHAVDITVRKMRGRVTEDAAMTIKMYVASATGSGKTYQLYRAIAEAQRKRGSGDITGA